MKKILATMLVVGLMVGSTHAAITAHYTFDEVTPGSWDVYIDLTGDTAGLSAYEVRVLDPLDVSYTENILGTETGGTPVGFQADTLVAGDVGDYFSAGNFQHYGGDPELEYIAIPGIGMTTVSVPPVSLDAHALLGTLTTPEGLTGSDFSATVIGLLEVGAEGFVPAIDIPVATFEVNVYVPLPGDANHDGQVDVTDLGRLATGWQTAQGWEYGDFDDTGFVDVADLGILATNWQVGVGAVVPTPEPATMSLLVIGGLAILRRKRK